jgi:D-arabinose 1-dehydrogenase-like Zn-dependent alcohol dehydrogenase
VSKAIRNDIADPNFKLSVSDEKTEVAGSGDLAYRRVALKISVLENIRPMIETLPLEQAADAYARMMQGKARFRMVLVTKDGVDQSAPVR